MTTKTFPAHALRRGDSFRRAGAIVTLTHDVTPDGPHVCLRFERADGSTGEAREYANTNIQLETK